ncbi:MAG: patatin-like phospholipase family protein [Candidatus Sericytochromatia bacterium]
MTSPPCALALTGGVAKGAFHAGVLKSMAEHEIVPTSIVGSSAGALNGGLSAKLIAEDRFTPYWVDRMCCQLWLQQASLQKLWGNGEITDNSLRSLLGETRLSIFMLRNLLDWLSPVRLRELLQLRFTSILSDRHFRQSLEQIVKAPEKIEREVHFAAAVTSLTGAVETYANQSLISHGGYISFHLRPGQDAETIAGIFDRMRTVMRASGSFPGVFPPVPLMHQGKIDWFTDGGLTKNAPFGRAIKLDPNVRTIFLVSCMPITQPTSGRIDNMMTIVDQVYKIILNKDLANDFRKIQQINEKIEKLHRLMQSDGSGQFMDNEFNRALIDVAGFKSLESFLNMRTVEIVIIEPTMDLEGDPFAGLYRTDRVQLLERYIELGYEAAQSAIGAYLARKRQEARQAPEAEQADPSPDESPEALSAE